MSSRRVGKGNWGVITERVCNEILEGRRKSYTRCQRDAIVEVPELSRVVIIILSAVGILASANEETCLGNKRSNGGVSIS
jgi:hypothetical protein